MQIAVIGTGQLGSRHLQSLAGLAGPHVLHAVEPSPVAQQVVRERLGAAGGRVAFHASCDSLPGSLDVAIVATGAAVRRKVLTALLKHRQVGHLLLEKILFQSVADCLWAEGFLAEHRVQAWVNFPRRVQPVYQRIRQRIVPGKPLDLHVTGSRWGLATSAVHFLDLVLFLTGDSALSVDRFEALTYASRHAGCLEAFGLMAGVTPAGHSYAIRAWPEGNAPVRVVVEGSEQRFVVTESDHQALLQTAAAASQWQAEAGSHPFLYQSELTGSLVEGLIATGRWGLTDYAGALSSHLPFLRTWNRHFAPGADPDTTLCPVT